MRLIGLDPGSTVSGYVLFDGRVLESGVLDNELLLERLHTFTDVDMLAIEMINGMGMRVGASVFDTCVWIGRFMENWRLEKGQQAVLIKRDYVKRYFFKKKKITDSDIRQAVIERLGPPGTKSNKGPTYGVTSHAWQALAVAYVAKNKNPLTLTQTAL